MNLTEENLLHNNPDLQIETLPGNKLKICQNKKLFCYGIDAVLLSNFAKAGQNKEVFDFCTGNGIIPLLMSEKYKTSHFTGIELQSQCAELARQSVILNEKENQISILCQDIKDIKKNFRSNSANVITVNPPYMKGQTDINAAEKATPKEIARHEIFCTLEDIAQSAFYLLKSKGTIYMIHKPYRLAEIFTVLSNNHLEPKRMQFVVPFENEAPTMVLIEAVKESKPNLIIEKPLVVYKEKNIYTEEVKRIYCQLGVM